MICIALNCVHMQCLKLRTFVICRWEEKKIVFFNKWKPKKLMMSKQEREISILLKSQSTEENKYKLSKLSVALYLWLLILKFINTKRTTS